MFELDSVKKNKFNILNINTDEKITLSVDEICNFIKDNTNNINMDFVLDILNNVKDDTTYTAISETTLTALTRNLFGIENTKELYKFIEKNLNIISPEMLRDLVLELPTKLITKFYKKHQKDIDLSLQTEIMCRLPDDVALRFLEQNKDTLDINSQIDIITSLSHEKTKIEFLKQNKYALDINSQIRIITSLSNQSKLKFIAQNDKLTQSAIVKIVSSIDDDKIILEFLDQNSNIRDFYKKTLIQCLSTEKHFEIYNTNKYDCQSFITIREMSSVLTYLLDEQKDEKSFLLNFINNNLKNFTIRDFDEYEYEYDEFDMEDIIGVLDENQANLSSEQVIFLIYNCSPNKQEEYYNALSDKLYDIQKYMLLTTLKETGTNISNIDEKLNELTVPPETKVLSNKLIKNFGLIYSVDENAIKFLSQNGITFLGENTIYQLFKYCVYNNALPDVSKVLENPNLFESYLEFRKQHLPQNPFDVLNIQNALTEFNTYYNLIEDCLQGELTEQELSIFISALNDRNIEVAGKDDLQNYPAKRSEYIDNLIKEDLDSAITYLLTGFQAEEYETKEKLFFKDEQLNITLNDFSEDLQTDIIYMQNAKKVISLILSLPLEIKQQVLESFKQNLENEFTPEGSAIAYIRNSFAEFEQNLKRLYGKELQEALSGSKLPTPHKDKGVDIINLNGEDFKLLVHGLNAFGQGSETFENREVGKAYICTSLISQDCIYRADAKIYYGFKNISPKSLALEGNTNIGSGATGDNSLEIVSSTTKFMTAENLLQATKNNFNEIVLFRDQVDEFGHITPIKPDYIVTFGKEPTEQERSEAERLNIPIVVINEQIYEQKIEEKKQRQQTETTTLQETKPTISLEDNLAIQDLIHSIIEQAQMYCTASQQNAIMSEITKEYRLSKEQIKEDKEELNV